MRIIYAYDYDNMSVKAGRIMAAMATLKPGCVLSLATGSSPIGLYGELIKRYHAGEVDFSAVKTVNLDEYVGLPPAHDQSYRYFMNDNLFNHINIAPGSTHVPDGMASDPAAECARYDALIESLGGVDMQLLGIGNNGHIGFNEPGDAFSTGTHVQALTGDTINANARFFDSADAVPKTAYTMGVGSILGARKILLVVSGEAKADILYRSLFGPVEPSVPASILQFHPDVTVVADNDALTIIRQKHPECVIR